MNELGLTALQQFGNGFSNDTTFAGAFLRADMFLDLKLTLDVIGHYNDNGTCAGIWTAADRMLDLNAAGMLFLRGAWLGVASKSEDNRFEPVFDNLFIGDAIKMSAIDAPFYYIQGDYTLPLDWPLSFGALCVAQTEDQRAQEADVYVSFQPRFGVESSWAWASEYLRVNAIYSQVNADDITDAVDTWKLELRWAL